ncbi:MAG: hypothetical protein JXB47_19130, partial [Anaerolineae bacterium]|nr:hypothetical protein [Anaerolineae bacterium]
MTQTTGYQNRRWAAGVGALTLLLTLGWLAPVLNKYDGDALILAGIGTKFSEGLQPDDEGYVVGYDGQFAYYIAIFGFDPPAPHWFDAAAYRYQRILYPALAALLSFGSKDLVPWAMLGINVAAHSAGAALLAYLLAALGGRPVYALYALVYSLWIGEIVAVHLDLNEPLAMALGLAGAALYYHKRVGWAALCFALAALAKDIGVVMAAGAAFYAWFAGRRRDAILLGGSAAGAYVMWMAALRLILGRSMLEETIPPRLSPVPFVGLRGALDIEGGLGAAGLVFILMWLVVPGVLWGWSAVRAVLREPATLSAWMLIC